MKKILTAVLSLTIVMMLGASVSAAQTKDAEYYYQEGKKYEWLNNKPGAIEQYTQALNINQNYDDARIARARLSYYFDRYQDALYDFDYFYNKPGYGAAVYHDFRINCKLKLGMYEAALDDMFEVILAYGGQAKVYQDMIYIVNQYPQLQYKLNPESHPELLAKYQHNAKALRDYARTFDDDRLSIKNKDYYKYFMSIAAVMQPDMKHTLWDGTAQIGTTVYRIAPDEGAEIDVNYEQKNN